MNVVHPPLTLTSDTLIRHAKSHNSVSARRESATSTDFQDDEAMTDLPGPSGVTTLLVRDLWVDRLRN